MPDPKQYTSIRYGERLTEIGAVPSIGSIGDSFDNALAESVNALYKTELIYGPDQGPWRTVAEVELATLMWVKWYNEQRIHGYLNNIPPTEYEDAYHAQRSHKQLIGNQKKQSPTHPVLPKRHRSVSAHSRRSRPGRLQPQHPASTNP
jgi:putative transposase